MAIASLCAWWPLQLLPYMMCDKVGRWSVITDPELMREEEGYAQDLPLGALIVAILHPSHPFLTRLFPDHAKPHGVSVRLSPKEVDI
jgi:hypothetical protein